MSQPHGSARKGVSTTGDGILPATAPDSKNTFRLKNAFPDLTGRQYEISSGGNLMCETDAHRPIHVTCYSGRRYADRPASFIWQGEQYEVSDVEKEWLEPRQKHFTVRARDKKGERGEKRFDISYDEQEDSWSLREV